MIGVLLITHGYLARELLAAAESVVGPQMLAHCICFEGDDDIRRRQDEVNEALSKIDEGRGVIILTDLFGGSPCNIALASAHGRNTAVIAGVNLPMLLKLLAIRQRVPLDQAAAATEASGRKYIGVVTPRAPVNACKADA